MGEDSMAKPFCKPGSWKPNQAGHPEAKSPPERFMRRSQFDKSLACKSPAQMAEHCGWGTLLATPVCSVGKADSNFTGGLAVEIANLFLELFASVFIEQHSR